ncbi:MAG: hypothetical protein KBT03_00540 [Bacteroidales bacterium]|nr:hypothetical protein [Candidatus Scybalousia scybalohippi]
MPRKNNVKKNEEKEVKKYDNGTDFFSIDQILEDVENVVDKKDFSIDRYQLSKYVYLDICFNDDGNDTAQLNVCGVAVKCRIVKAKNRNREVTYFLGLPSYKKKDGDYADLVIIFNKEMNECISELLERIYG